MPTPKSTTKSAIKPPTKSTTMVPRRSTARAASTASSSGADSAALTHDPATLIRNLVKVDDMWLQAVAPTEKSFNLVKDGVRLPKLQGPVSREALIGLMEEFGQPVIEDAAQWLLAHYVKLFLDDQSGLAASISSSSGALSAGQNLTKNTPLKEMDSLVIRLWSTTAHEELHIDEESPNLDFHGRVLDLWIGPQRLLKIGCSKCFNVDFVNPTTDKALANDVCAIKVQRVKTTRPLNVGEEFRLSDCGTYPSECECHTVKTLAKAGGTENTKAHAEVGGVAVVEGERELEEEEEEDRERDRQESNAAIGEGVQVAENDAAEQEATETTHPMEVQDAGPSGSPDNTSPAPLDQGSSSEGLAPAKPEQPSASGRLGKRRTSAPSQSLPTGSRPKRAKNAPNSSTGGAGGDDDADAKDEVVAGPAARTPILRKRWPNAPASGSGSAAEQAATFPSEGDSAGPTSTRSNEGSSGDPDDDVLVIQPLMNDLEESWEELTASVDQMTGRPQVLARQAMRTWLGEKMQSLVDW